jgi:PKD repeat protein
LPIDLVWIQAVDWQFNLLCRMAFFNPIFVFTLALNMKNQFTRFAALVCLSFCSLTGLQAQITQGGEPLSKRKLISVSDVPAVSLPNVDVARLVAEDAQRALLGKEFDRRFGQTFDVSYSLENSGAWQNLPNGDRVWQLKINSEKAQSINLTFSKYNLPAGATLFLIGKLNTIGALTNFNNQADEKLGTGLVWGDWVQLEYYEPAYSRGLGKLEIGKATHGYKNPFSIMGWGESDFCEMNVNCPLGGPWQNEKRSIGRIIDNGDVCTGALVNNTLQDGKPYFLTANHCYSASSTTWVFSFNWEAPTCTTPSTPIPENETISGSTLKARLAASDFCLFELSSKPPASYKVYYSGWSALDVPSTSSTIIHHPAGDIKKISFDTDAAVSSGYGVSAPNDNSHWRIGNYEFETTTEGGSSGSPMFDQNHRIVGQLHGGPANCTNGSSDFYGKVSRSWADGTTPATRLKDWLDPLNSGALVLDGMDPACNRLLVRLPYQPNIDTVVKPLPHLWKVKNIHSDSTFQLVQGGFGDANGKAFRIIAENFDPAGRGDSLLLAPVSVSRYKKIKFNFKYAYRRKANTQSDTLQLLVSQNCGSSFTKLQEWAGSDLVTDPSFGPGPFEPADTTLWKSVLINLDSTYNRSEQLVFAFGFTSGNAGILWLDQFRILGDTAKNKPFTRFESDKKFGCVGSQILFSDSSLNNPTSRLWLFEGGTPASSTDPNPSVSYSTSGSFKVTLITTNEEGSDTLVKTDYIQILLLGQTPTPFLQDFSAAGTFPPTGYILLNPESNVSWQKNDAVTAPGSPGGSLMFDNYSNPNVTGNRDWLFLPKITTAGKSHLKMRFKLAYKAYTSFGSTSPDTLSIGFSLACGGNFKKVWKKGGTQLATAGSQTQIYTPVAADWALVQLNLDSLLIYPEVSIGLENLFGYGNRIFIDDLFIDTTDNCPLAPTITVNSDSICLGKTLVLGMDSLEGATYNWSGPPNFSANTRVVTRVITAVNQGGQYRGTVTKLGCTSPVTNQQIFAFNNPAVPTFTQAGNTLTGPASMTNYIWIVNGTDTLPEHTRIITAPFSGSYVLVVFNAAGCSNSSNPVNVVVISVNPILESSGIRAYPNPTSGLLLLESKTDEKFEILGLFNGMGKNMVEEIGLSSKGKGQVMDFTKLSSGIYWVRIQKSGSIFVLPIQKGE